MAKLKHLIEIERGIRALAPGAHISYRSGRKHRILLVRIGDTFKKFSVASSPTVAEHAVTSTLKDVVRSFSLETPC